jgi:hypothetical protein
MLTVGRTRPWCTNCCPDAQALNLVLYSHLLRTAEREGSVGADWNDPCWRRHMRCFAHLYLGASSIPVDGGRRRCLNCIGVDHASFRNTILLESGWERDNNWGRKELGSNHPAISTRTSLWSCFLQTSLLVRFWVIILDFKKSS